MVIDTYKLIKKITLTCIQLDDRINLLHRITAQETSMFAIFPHHFESLDFFFESSSLFFRIATMFDLPGGLIG